MMKYKLLDDESQYLEKSNMSLFKWPSIPTHVTHIKQGDFYVKNKFGSKDCLVIIDSHTHKEVSKWMNRKTFIEYMKINYYLIPTSIEID